MIRCQKADADLLESTVHHYSVFKSGHKVGQKHKKKQGIPLHNAGSAADFFFFLCFFLFFSVFCLLFVGFSCL